MGRMLKHVDLEDMVPYTSDELQIGSANEYNMVEQDVFDEEFVGSSSVSKGSGNPSKGPPFVKLMRLTLQTNMQKH